MSFLIIAAKTTVTIATFFAMLGICIYFTPATLYAGMGLDVIFAPPVWAALALGGTVGMIGVYKKLTKQGENSSFFNRHATALSVLGLSLFFGGITQMELLTSLSTFVTTGIHGLFSPISSTSTFALPLLLGSFGVSFATCIVALLIPSFVLPSIYRTTRDLISPSKETKAHQKALKKTAKAIGYKSDHPFMKKLHQLYNDAPVNHPAEQKGIFNKKEVTNWGLKALITLAKTPEKGRAKKEEALLNEVKVCTFRVPT